MRQSTRDILKERLSVLAVIFACIALVVAAQEGQRLVAALSPTPTFTPAPPTATPAPTPTRPAAQSSPETPAAAGEASPVAQAAPQSVNFSGKWAGTFSDTVDGSPVNYQYTLDLMQQGTFLSGRSTIQKEDDPDAFARFVIRGQVSRAGNTFMVQLNEDLQGVQKLDAGSAVAPRITRLTYAWSEAEEFLEGEWVDRRSAAGDVTGTARLSRQ